MADNSSDDSLIKVSASDTHVTYFPLNHFWFHLRSSSHLITTFSGQLFDLISLHELDSGKIIS